MAHEFKIGTVAGGVGAITLLSALATPVPEPQASYRPYQKYILLGDLSQRGVGYSSAEWRFPRLTLAQRAQLRTFCTVASTNVYIRTINDAGAYANYLASMVWPEQDAAIQGGMVMNVIVRLEKLEATA